MNGGVADSPISWPLPASAERKVVFATIGEQRPAINDQRPTTNDQRISE
jgi:hypothetical protein